MKDIEELVLELIDICGGNPEDGVISCMIEALEDYGVE